MGANQSSDSDLMPRESANLTYRRGDFERMSTKSKAKPAPPHRPVITDVTHNAITLSWQPPHRNSIHHSQPIIAYTIEIAGPYPERQWRVLTASCQSTSYTARYLNTDSAYAFRVRAENIFGVGKVSAPSEVVTTKVYETSSDLNCFMGSSTPASHNNPPVVGSRKRHSALDYTRGSFRNYDLGDRKTSSLRRRHSFNVHLNGGVTAILNHSDINIQSPPSGTRAPGRNESGRPPLVRSDIYRTSLKPNRKISLPIFLPGTGTESLSRLRESRSSFRNSGGELSIGSGDSTPTSPLAPPSRSTSGDSFHMTSDVRGSTEPASGTLTTFGKEVKDASCVKPSRGSWQSSTSDIATTDSCGNSSSSGSNRNSCDSYSNSTSSGVDVTNCSDCSLSGIAELGHLHRSIELSLHDPRNTSLDLGSPCFTDYSATDDNVDGGQFHASDILSHFDDELDLLKDIEERLKLDAQLNDPDNDNLPPPPPSLLSPHEDHHYEYIAPPPLPSSHHHHHHYHDQQHLQEAPTTIPVVSDLNKGYYESLDNPWELNGSCSDVGIPPYPHPSHCESDYRGSYSTLGEGGFEPGNHVTATKSCTDDQDFRTLRSALHSSNVMVKRSRLHGDGLDGGDEWASTRGGKLSTIIDADEEEDAIRVTSI